MSKVYKFSYSDLVKNEKTVNWEILNFKQRVNESKTNVFIRTSKSDYGNDMDEDLKFELLIRSIGTSKRFIEIHFKTPNYTCLKYNLFMKINQSNQLIMKKDYHEVLANKWQLMKELNFENVPVKVDGSLELSVLFEIKLNGTLKEGNLPNCLKYDLENLLNNTTLYDVTLESVDGVQLPAHKIILAARSEVFKAHFEHGTTESLTNIIKTKFETEILQEVLHYIYTDCAPKLGNIATGVLVAADYYQLSGLKALCAKELYNKLTTENAIETLVLAELHSVSSLKEDIYQFLNDENNRAVYESSGWKTLEDAKLLKLIHENTVMK